MPLITHEMPLDLMVDPGIRINDYSYALLHKLIEDESYYNAIKKTFHQTLYLDNSCFELGASLSNELLYEWYLKLEPNVVILPDTLGNKKATLDQTYEFINQYSDTVPRGMVVIQGSTPDEMVECYQEFRDSKAGGHGFQMIGIPFVYSWVEKDPIVQANERIRLLRRLNDSRVVNKKLKHHLLGTWWAGEFEYYREYSWIYSVDTSNPVMAAIDGNRYTSNGVLNKPKANFDSSFNLKKSDIDMELLEYNCSMFRKIVNGDNNG